MNSRMKKKMVYLKSPSTDAAFNLALEQYVFDEMDRDCEYFMLWQNKNAAVVGKNQNTLEEINQSYVEEQGIQVVRRMSGGGAVYHDLGNLLFTFIVDGGELSRMDLHAFCYLVARALGKLGVEAVVGGRNDITIDGKKFSGKVGIPFRIFYVILISESCLWVAAARRIWTICSFLSRR